MKWTSRLWLPKNFGSLHIMIFRYCGNISVSMQRYFLKVRGVKKFMFRCHTLTHGTDLRRLPPLYLPTNTCSLILAAWYCSWQCLLISKCWQYGTVTFMYMDVRDFTSSWDLGWQNFLAWHVLFLNTLYLLHSLPNLVSELLLVVWMFRRFLHQVKYEKQYD